MTKKTSRPERRTISELIWLPGSVCELHLSELEKILIDKGYELSQVVIRLEHGYDGDDIMFYVERPETDEEYQKACAERAEWERKRKERNNKVAEKKREKERAEYERLKKKFG